MENILLKLLTLGNVETTFTVDNSKDDNTNQNQRLIKKMMQTIKQIML